MIFAFDLDGVIFGWDVLNYHPTRVGSVFPGCIETLKWIKKRGHKVVIFTCRTNPEIEFSFGYSLTELVVMVIKHLEVHGIPWDDVSVFKPDASWYFDDRSNFTSWDEVKKQIKELEFLEVANEHKPKSKKTIST